MQPKLMGTYELLEGPHTAAATRNAYSLTCSVNPKPSPHGTLATLVCQVVI